jgi:hypothetical protein
MPLGPRFKSAPPEWGAYSFGFLDLSTRLFHFFELFSLRLKKPCFCSVFAWNRRL